MLCGSIVHLCILPYIIKVFPRRVYWMEGWKWSSMTTITSHMMSILVGSDSASQRRSQQRASPCHLMHLQHAHRVPHLSLVRSASTVSHTRNVMWKNWSLILITYFFTDADSSSGDGERSPISPISAAEFEHDEEEGVVHRRAKSRSLPSSASFNVLSGSSPTLSPVVTRRSVSPNTLSPAVTRKHFSPKSSPILAAKNLFRLSGSHLLGSISPLSSPRGSPILGRKKMRKNLSRNSSIETDYVFWWMEDASSGEVKHWQQMLDSEGKWVYFWHLIQPKMKPAYWATVSQLMSFCFVHFVINHCHMYLSLIRYSLVMIITKATWLQQSAIKLSRGWADICDIKCNLRRTYAVGKDRPSSGAAREILFLSRDIVMYAISMRKRHQETRLDRVLRGSKELGGATYLFEELTFR